MFFRDVIGQDLVKKQLTESVRAGRVPHAQLFLGPEGAGGLALALAYASYLQCEQPLDDDSCGTCRACLKSHKMVHPDVHYSFPNVGSKVLCTANLPEWRSTLAATPYPSLIAWLNVLNAENKQPNINTDECRDIANKLSLKVFEGRYKILVMWLPEYLGKEGNRLLKLIEEPPEDTVFLLVAEQQEKILTTILSRCQLVKTPPLSDQDVAKGLIKQLDLEPARAEAIARLAEGNFTKALELCEEGENDNAGLLLEWFRICHRGEIPAICQWADKISGNSPDGGKRFGRKDHKYFLQYTFHFLREAFISSAIGPESVRLPQSEKEFATKFAQNYGVEKIDQVTKLLERCALAVERNANPKILFLDTSIKLNKIFISKL